MTGQCKNVRSGTVHFLLSFGQQQQRLHQLRLWRDPLLPPRRDAHLQRLLHQLVGDFVSAKVGEHDTLEVYVRQQDAARLRDNLETYGP